MRRSGSFSEKKPEPRRFVQSLLFLQGKRKLEISKSDGVPSAFNFVF